MVADTPLIRLRIWLARCPVVAILRGIRPDEAIDMVMAIQAVGIRIIEVPLNSPDPFKNIEILCRRFGDELLIGAGTVLGSNEVESLRKIGAGLVVTPNTNPEVIGKCVDQGMISIIGCLTPTEALAALNAGATALKLFPAGDLPASYVQSLRAVLPTGTVILPVGGIGEHNLADYWRRGIQGVGLAGNLYRPGDKPAAVAENCRRLLAVLERASGQPSSD